jgi:hypothetical protein
MMIIAVPSAITVLAVLIHYLSGHQSSFDFLAITLIA